MIAVVSTGWIKEQIFHYRCRVVITQQITGKYRFETLEINGPVVIGGVQVLPGDLILADTSGVVAVPSSHIETVLMSAEEATAKEHELSRAIRKGASLEELNQILSMAKW